MGTALPGEVKTTKLADDIYPLLIELHGINPIILQRFSPSICVQLRAEKEEIDLTAVKSLKRLFSSKHLDPNTEFSKDFRNLLGRFNNPSGVVRLAKDDSVNSMPSSHDDHDDHDDDDCDAPVDISTKVISTINGREVLVTFKTAALSTGADVREAIEPQWDNLSTDCSYFPDDDNDGLRTGHEYMTARRDSFIENTDYPSTSLIAPTPSLKRKRKTGKEKRASESKGASYCKDNKINLFQTAPDFTR
jgi:hypothetical protein